MYKDSNIKRIKHFVITKICVLLHSLFCKKEKCPDGGIGRRVGLKHQWMQVLVGSIPTLGTNLKR